MNDEPFLLNNNSKVAIFKISTSTIEEFTCVYEKLAQGKIVVLDLTNVAKENQEKIKVQLQHVCDFAKVTMETVSENIVSIDPSYKK